MSKELRENTGKAELPRNERGEGRTVEEKLLRQLRMSGHFLRYQTEGRGGQRRVLAALSHREAISQRELMEQLEVKAGSLSEILGKLESRGLIVRKQNEEDRRNRDLSITPAGRQALEELSAQYRESAQGLFSGLEAGEREQLAALLSKLLESWEAQKTQPREGGCAACESRNCAECEKGKGCQGGKHGHRHSGEHHHGQHGGKGGHHSR